MILGADNLQISLQITHVEVTKLLLFLFYPSLLGGHGQQHVRVSTTTALPNFSVPWALLSWLTRSLVAVTMVSPGDSLTVQSHSLTAHWEASKPQRYPQLGHRVACDLVWSLFIPVLHFCNTVILDFLSNELIYQWVTSAIKMRGGKYLSSNSASWKTANQGIHLRDFL